MQNRISIILAFSLLLILFVIDIFVPPEIGFWSFYVVPVIILSDKASVLLSCLFAGFTTILMVIGLLLSPRMFFIPQSFAILNRCAGIALIWIILYMTIRRAQAYRELNESASLNEAILSNMTEGIVIIGPDGILRRWNEAALRISKTPEEVINGEYPLSHPLWRLQDVNGNTLVTEKWPTSRVLHGERFHAEVLKVIQPETKEQWYGSFSGVPIYDPEGKLRLAVITFHDVTRIIETEKQLTEALELARKKASELKARGRLLNALMEQIPEGIFITGPGGEILYASRYSEQLLGIPMEEIVSIPENERPGKWHIYHTDEWTLSLPDEQPLFRSVHSGQTIHEQEWIIKQDGKVKTVLINASPVRDEQGRIRGAISGWRDVTEQVAGRKEAQFQLARYEAITNNLADGLIIADPRGNILSINPAALKMYQLSSSETLGNFRDYASHFELFDLQNNPVPISEWPLSRVLNGEKFTGAELRVHRIDTGKKWFANYSGTPVFDNKGKIILAILTVRDITVLRLAVEEAEEGKRILDAIMEYIPLGVLIATTPELEVVTSSRYDRENVGECLGITVLQRALGCSLRRSDTGETVSTENHPLYRALNKGEVVRNEEWRFNDIKGNEIVAIINASPLIDSLGRTSGAVLMWLDITERKRGEQEMERLLNNNMSLNSELRKRAAELEFANSELETFSYSVSHDLRSPLSTIEGFISILSQDYGHVLDDNGREYISHAQSGIKKMQNIIEDMLQLSRISRYEMSRTEINLSKMVADFLEELHAAEPERNVAVSVQENVIAFADPRLIHLALENLLNNAWKFTSGKPDAEIEFGAYQSQGKTVYFVKDNGAGFDMNKADKLFKPFVRLHSQKEFKGTGIGLPIVLRVIRRHGGKIWAESKVDKGTTFHFTLG